MDPAGSARTSPLGVNTNTSCEYRSPFSDSMNSPGSVVSRCQSIMRESHSRRSPSAVSAVRFSSLYSQCAATPNSAVRCISGVRIWISSGLPCGPMTVVCSDWYMFSRGMAM